MSTVETKAPASSAPANGKAQPIIGNVPARTDTPRMTDSAAAERLIALVGVFYAPAPKGARPDDELCAAVYGGSALAGFLKARGAWLKSRYVALAEIDRIGASNPNANVKVKGGRWPTAKGTFTDDANGARIYSTLTARTQGDNAAALRALARASAK